MGKYKGMGLKDALGWLFSLVMVLSLVSCQKEIGYDVLIVGGSASGTTAGLQASRMGANTLIVEETPWLGGMLTSAGVSAIDGNYKLPSGLFGEFRDSLVAHYGSAEALKTGWVSNVLFEPSVGNAIFQRMAKAEKHLSVWHNAKFLSAEKTMKGWAVTVKKDGEKQVIQTKVLIDATELGDVAKYCGVKYDIGMEARAISGEEIAPEEANDIIQDLTYVMILKDYGVDKTISKPASYDPSFFYCTAQSDNCTDPKPGQVLWSADQMIRYGQLPNNKYMINWPIEGNDYYVNIIEMDDDARAEALEKAKQFSLCYLYYLQTELGFSTFDLADDEFPTVDKFPFIPYHRESRRIHGLVRFNVNHVSKPFDQAEALYRTGIAVGDYPIDHHHNRYPEWETLPDLHFYPVPSYNLPLGALIPKDVEGLIVGEKSISVSNLLNGSTRLQPVVLQIGQAAGVLAALAVKMSVNPSEVPVRMVQQQLLENDAYLMPYVDVTKQDASFKAVQRIGATGIIKGKGQNVGWENLTFFYPDSMLTAQEFKDGLSDIYPGITFDFAGHVVTVEEVLQLVNHLSSEADSTANVALAEALWAESSFGVFGLQEVITRAQCAVILDRMVDPFSNVPINHSGQFLND